MDCPLDQNSIHHAEALAIGRKRFKGLDDEPVD